MIYDYDWFSKQVFVSRETFAKLEIFHDLLIKWQQKINLISPADIPNIWSRHILDSAQLIKFIPNKMNKLSDLGSGAGFPALILSIIGVGGIELIESDQKKSAFLREAIRVTDSTATVINKRIEELEPHKKSDMITARACAGVKKLLELSAPLIGENSILCFPKGKNYITELNEARKEWEFSLDVAPSITDPDGVILIIREAKNKK